MGKKKAKSSGSGKEALPQQPRVRTEEMLRTPTPKKKTKKTNGGSGAISAMQFGALVAFVAVAVVCYGFAGSGTMMDVGGTGSKSTRSSSSSGGGGGGKSQGSSSSATTSTAGVAESKKDGPPPPFQRNAASSYTAKASTLQLAAGEWYDAMRAVSDLDSLCGSNVPQWDRAQIRDLATTAATMRGSEGWAQPLRTALMILLRLQDHEGLDAFLSTVGPMVGPVAMRSIVGAPALHLATDNSDATCVAKHLLKGAFDRQGWIEAYMKRVNGTSLPFEQVSSKLPPLLNKTHESESIQQKDVRKWANAKSLLCLQHLLRYADVDEPDNFGETAIHIASYSGNAAAVQLLLASGADPDHQGRGMKPVEMAALRGFDDVLTALTEGNAHMTPLAKDLTMLSLREPMTSDASTDDPSSKSSVKNGLRTDSGGWETDKTVEDAADAHTCNLSGRAPDVVDATDMTSDMFEQFYHTKRPVVVRGAATDWKFRSKWTSKKFLKKFGNRPVEYGAVPYSGFFNGTLQRGPLKKVVSESRGDYYVFIAAEETDLVEDVLEFGQAPLPLPPVFNEGNLAANPKVMQFYLGGASTGAPVHFHDDAWNALAFGLKRWFLWEPDDAFYRKDAPMDWAAQNLQKHCATCKLGRNERAGAEYPCPIEFTQHPGDVVYVPRGFAHATLNIQTSIGFAVEFQTVISTEWGSMRYSNDEMKPIADEDLHRVDEGDDDLLKEAGVSGDKQVSSDKPVSGDKPTPKNWRKEKQGKKKGAGPNFKFIGK